MRWLFLLIPLLCWRAMATGLIDPEDGMVDMSRYLQENPYGFLPIPLVITEPAVGYGGGLFGLFLHGKGRQADGQFIPPAMSAFGGGGTQNGTWFVGGGIATPGRMTTFAIWLQEAMPMSIWIYIPVTYWALAITGPWKPKLAVMAVCKSFSFAQGILPFFWEHHSSGQRWISLPAIIRSSTRYGGSYWVKAASPLHWGW